MPIVNPASRWVVLTVRSVSLLSTSTRSVMRSPFIAVPWRYSRGWRARRPAIP